MKLSCTGTVRLMVPGALGLAAVAGSCCHPSRLLVVERTGMSMLVSMTSNPINGDQQHQPGKPQQGPITRCEPSGGTQNSITITAKQSKQAIVDCLF